MARGRKPKPVEQKRREGNPGRRPLPAPVLVAGRPSAEHPLSPPDDLVPEARQAWDQIVPTLSQFGLLDGIDGLALEAMCTQWARAKQAAQIVATEGPMSEGSMGQSVPHPALAIERAAHQMFLRYAEQYALTPTARTRLGLAELQRRSMKAEMDEQLGKPKLRRVK